MSDELKKLKAFATIWNSIRTYPTNYELERVFGKKIRAIRAMADRYNEKREQYPELKELVWRRSGTGQPVPVPMSALRQLDDFRFHPDKLNGKHGAVITSAQFGANIHSGFFDTLKGYCAYRDFPLIVMPIKYGPVRYIGGRYVGTFPDELKGHIIFEDLFIAKGKLQLNVTRMRPTLERFLTDRICEMGGPISQIFAAPVLELEHRISIEGKYPKAIMTTGAVSIPNYTLDNLGQQDRTAEIAVENHTLAAIVVEWDDKGTFHFRQLCANKKGEFYDIDPIHVGGRFFSGNTNTHKPKAIEGLVIGDYHTGKTCPNVKRVTFGKHGMVERLDPSNIVVHDFVDGDSISKYEQHQASRRGWKAPKLYDSLEIELQNNVKELKWIKSRTPNAKLHMVASNHPEFVTEYIENMRWVKDDINLSIGSRLYSDMIQDLEKKKPAKVDAVASDPVILYLRKHCPFVNVLERTDKLLLGAKSILCSMHGDIGTRGAPSRSTNEFRKLNIKIILGHNHTGTILGSVWRVGTSTPRTQFYVTTPKTQWTNTHCVIFDNGERMLINIINNKWYHNTNDNHLSNGKKAA